MNDSGTFTLTSPGAGIGQIHIHQRRHVRPVREPERLRSVQHCSLYPRLRTTTMEPVNLRERFGNRYRIGFDPSRSSAWDHDPWMMTVRCRYGEIYPHG